MVLQPATRLGPYEILATIGAGGMGEVYRAKDTRLDRTVAIKVLPEHRSSTPQARERFEREAKAVSSLSHPHICPLYDIGHQDGIDYLVMEYLEGQTLADRLRKSPLPQEQVLQYAIEITDALDTAHKHAVIHRDLKPGNIMLTKTGAKLLDFGLAKVRTTGMAAGVTALPTETSPLTSEGTILGTLQYMAPEQLEGDEADARTDIFALGAVIYEMATGRKAFEGKSQASLISAIMTAEPPPISTLQTMGLPPLDHVVRTCMAKDPDARWQTAHDVLVELKWIAAGGEMSQAAAPAAVVQLRKRERLAWMVAAGLFAALLAALAVPYLRPAPETRVVQFEVTLGENVQLGVLAISPDGQYVAFDAADQSQSRIWLRALNSQATVPVPGTEGGQWPFWSPNSRQIGFSTGTALKKISLAGGSPQTICNMPAAGTWNRDGVIILSPPSAPRLYRVSAAGGEPKPLIPLDPSRQETGHGFPQFLPDGRRFIYLAVSSKPENSGTYLGSLDSPQVRRIHDGETHTVYAPPGFLVFNRGPSLMAQRFDVRKSELSGDPVLLAESVAAIFGISPYGSFSVSGNGMLAYVPGLGSRLTQLVWFDRNGRRLGTIAEPADYSNPAISPDQKRVAVGKRDPQTKTRDIWVIDLQRGTSSRLTFDPGDDTNAAWSPDGTRIAFTSDRKGHRDIYVKPSSGSGEEQLVLESNESKYVEHWSSDGQYLMYGGDTGIDERLVLMGEHKSIPLPKFTQDQGRFCPSAGGAPRWFAYTSDETGAPRVYVRSFAGALAGSGGKWQISTNGGSEPNWRGDGKELFYVQGNKLMSVEINANGESFQAGVPKELFEARLPELLRNRYDVTPDGKRFLVNVPVEQKRAASFTVVLNWPELLKR